LALEQGDSVLLEPAEHQRMVLEGGGELLLVRIAPAAALKS
jgi:hypothetical protein